MLGARMSSFSRAACRTPTSLARRQSTAPSPAAAAAASDGSGGGGPIGVVMLNMGGPSSLRGAEDGVQPFLGRLFADREIIQLGPLQKILGPWIARNRSPKIIEQYSRIGGRSPIGAWTRAQGAAMEAQLNAGDASARGGASFKHYVAFRYAPPLTGDALLRMRDDGVTRAIAFAQYPQFSCTTTGSSLNHLWRECLRLGLERTFAWSVIDRWHAHPTFLAAAARRVALGLRRFPAAERDGVVIVFSAHSIPMLVVNRGDPYTAEIAATVGAVMARLRAGVDVGDGDEGGGDAVEAGTAGAPPAGGPPPGDAHIAAPRNAHILAWQSKVGFLPWMGPQTAAVLEGLGRQGARNVLVVPIAFTSDHVETLFEIDIEYAHVAAAAGITRFERAPSLNGEPLLARAQAELVREHLAARAPAASAQYALNCAGCTNPACRSILNPAHAYTKARDGAAAADTARAAAAAAAGGEGGAAGDAKASEGAKLAWPTDANVAELRAARDAGPAP